nr:hypothetical protein [Tanacetum cinerariifolium]
MVGGSTVKEMTTNFGKLDKFEGNDFRRWQKKTHFLLMTLKVVYVLITPMPKLMEDDTVKVIRRRAKWKNDDYICRGHILNEDASSKKFLDFKHTLKHGKDDLSLVQLGSHLRIEESLRAQDSDKGKGKEVVGPFMNMIEEGGKNKNNKQNKGKNLVSIRTTMVLIPTRNQSWNVGSVARLVTSRGIAIVVKRTTQMLVVQERGLRTNPKTKWIDSGATTNICKDRCWFKTYEPVEDESVLYMGDDHFAPIHGKGSVVLEFSLKKSITLFNVLCVLKLRFGYYNNGMFILNLNKVPDDFGSVYMSSSTIVNFSLWHARIEHVHYKRMLEMSKDDLIPAIDENQDKCTTSPYTPQQNGVAERKNKALKEMVNFMLSYSGLSEGLWGEAMAVVRLSDPKRKTLGEKGIDCIFVGYDEHSKAYRFYVIKPNEFFLINSIKESRDAIFDENHFSSIPRQKDIIPNSIESQRDDHSNNVPSETPEPRKDPRTYNEAMQSHDAAFWKEAIDDEIGSIMENNTRTKGKDRYFDTYAPVARITSIRLLLALAAIHNLVIHQMDVKTAFLNGDLDEEVYMKQPKRFVTQCVYKFDSSCKGVIICLYVDDMLIFETDQSHIDKTKKFLSSNFSMKDMGEVDVILDCSPMSTPIDPVEKLKPNTGKPMDQPEYSRAIGCLMYVMTSTRPDIAYEFGRLTRFTSNHSRQHWHAITRVFKYLKSGWVFLLGGGVILWASKKQTCITGSTMKSEFVALVAAGKEAEWLRNLIHEILIWPKPIAPISIYCNSAATFAKAYS